MYRSKGKGAKTREQFQVRKNALLHQGYPYLDCRVPYGKQFDQCRCLFGFDELTIIKQLSVACHNYIIVTFLNFEKFYESIAKL